MKNFFADTNHMGAIEGDVLVENQPTDARGDITIPDGDIVYGLTIDKAHWVIVDPKPRSWPDQIAQRIAGESFTVVMRRQRGIRCCSHSNAGASRWRVCWYLRA